MTKQNEIQYFQDNRGRLQRWHQSFSGAGQLETNTFWVKS